MSHAEEEYCRYESAKKTCVRCNKEIKMTELFKLKEMKLGEREYSYNYICVNCARPSDKLCNWTKSDKQCVSCKKYYRDWTFLTHNSDGTFSRFEKCLCCRLFERMFKNVKETKDIDVDIDVDVGDIAKDSNSGKKITRSRSNHKRDSNRTSYDVNDLSLPKFIPSPQSSLVNNIESGKEDIDTLLKCFPLPFSMKMRIEDRDERDEYKKYKRCERKCDKCGNNKSILDLYIYDNRKSYCLNCASDEKRRNKEIVFSNWILLDNRGKECSRCNKVYPLFCYIQDDYSDTDICLDCRKNENLRYVIECDTLKENVDDGSCKDLTSIYDDFRKNNKRIKCCLCNTIIDKVSAYGSVRKDKLIEYEKKNRYFCIDCVARLKQKKGKYFKRVFDDESEEGQECSKCKRRYPLWHYVPDRTKGEIMITELDKSCLECRSSEKLTKYKEW